MIFKGETVDERRSILFDLQDAAGAPITGVNWGTTAAGALRLRAPTGVLVNADLTRVTEIGTGTYLYALTSANVANAGKGVLQIDGTKIAGAQSLHYPFEVDDPRAIAGLFEAVLEGPNQYDGLGRPGGTDYTVADALRLILGYSAANATGLDTTNGQAVIKSMDGLVNRIVAQLANGNRTVTSTDPG